MLEDEVECDPSGGSNVAPVLANRVPPVEGEDVPMDDEFVPAAVGGAAPCRNPLLPLWGCFQGVDASRRLGFGGKPGGVGKPSLLSCFLDYWMLHSPSFLQLLLSYF